MSYIFDVNDTTVWSPSLAVGNLYVAVAETIASQLDVPSGLTADAEDMYDIDMNTFRAFVQTAAVSPLAQHPVSAAMLDGFVATSIVLMQRADVSDDVVAPIAAQLSNDPVELAKGMAT